MTMLRGTAVALIARAPLRSRAYGGSARRVLPILCGAATRSEQSNSRRCYSVVADAPVPTKRKVYDSVEEAIKDVKSGDVLLSGGTCTSEWSESNADGGPFRAIPHLFRVRTLRYTW